MSNLAQPREHAGRACNSRSPGHEFQPHVGQRLDLKIFLNEKRKIYIIILLIYIIILYIIIILLYHYNNSTSHIGYCEYLTD